MKIIIAAGTGFLGRALERYLLNKNHQVIILTRNPKNKNEVFWDAKNIGNWKNELENSDVLINLTGKSVDCRYTDRNKKEILDSRILSTRILQNAIESCENPPKIWLNSSSATIYIHSETHQNTEQNGIIGDDFSMNICKSWEKEFFRKNDKNIRKIALRTSIVLGNEGGAYPKMKLITKLGLGGKQGNGLQKMSWIHIEDFCRAVEFCIKDTDIKGSINVTSPNPISNEEFMKTLRKVFHKSFGFYSPGWLLEVASIFLKTETELLLKSRNVYPEILINEGFQFTHHNLDDAIENLYHKKSNSI